MLRTLGEDVEVREVRHVMVNPRDGSLYTRTVLVMSEGDWAESPESFEECWSLVRYDGLVVAVKDEFATS